MSISVYFMTFLSVGLARDIAAPASGDRATAFTSMTLTGLLIPGCDRVLTTLS
jgi:hypothetical protein